MNNQLRDDKIITMLDIIQNISLQAYLNVKLNIVATCKSLTTENMEKSFFHWQETGWHDSDYRIYQVEPCAEDAVAYYLQRPCNDIAGSYLVVAPDHSHAALYHCNAEKYIISYRHLFKPTDVKDILQTFNDWLRPVYDSFNFDAGCDSTAKVYALSESEAMLDYDGEGE